MLKGYDNFFLPAGDLAIARDFYEGTLGLAVTFDFSARGMIAFKVGDEEAAIILRSHTNVKPSIVFEVEDVRAVYMALKEKGVVFLTEPHEIQTGLAVEFEDPAGNRLGITDYSKGPELANKTKSTE